MITQINESKTLIKHISCKYKYNFDDNFLKISFRFDLKASNGYHDLMQKTITFSDNAIVSVKGNDYGICSLNVNKNEATISLNNADLSEKSGIL